MRKSFAALLLAVTAGGCGVQRPVAEVADVRVEEATEQGSRVLVRVALQNRGDTPLAIRQTHYTLTVDDEVFEFTDLAAATIPANGVQTLLLPAAVRVPAASIGNREYAVKGSVVYEPPGEIRDLLTDSGVPLPRVSFSQSGRLTEAPAPPTP